MFINDWVYTMAGTKIIIGVMSNILYLDELKSTKNSFKENKQASKKFSAKIVLWLINHDEPPFKDLDKINSNGYDHKYSNCAKTPSSIKFGKRSKTIPLEKKLNKITTNPRLAKTYKSIINL